jgi:hypothetical protein
MADDRVMLRRKAFNEIRSAALADLERRGYEVRGKHLPKLDKYLSGVPRSQTLPRAKSLVRRIYNCLQANTAWAMGGDLLIGGPAIHLGLLGGC